MPIKPENRGRYPSNWKQIRAQILERAGNCCEQCKVRNHAIIQRGWLGDKGTYRNIDDVLCPWCRPDSAPWINGRGL
ncbi:hypothetical protein [Paraburkholderia bannensis]|uniref:hypothetical protein n=1 Tax=Paraburkholderia bannensis TaxID=765414 RepID=UPI00048A143D|nr:hypothetical protein [Paraburkholderia bannensis]